MDAAAEAAIDQALNHWNLALNTGQLSGTPGMDTLVSTIRDMLSVIKQALGQQGTLSTQHTQLQNALQQIMGRVDTVALQAGNNRSGGHNKGVLDCRAVNSLATIPTDKSHFRNWEDRLINAYIQYAGVKARALFKLIIYRLYRDQ